MKVGAPVEVYPERWPSVHKTPPSAKVLSAMTMSFVHELVDAIDGARQYTESGVEMPEGVTWRNVVQACSALCYAGATTSHLPDMSDGKRPPSRIADVLLAADPRTLSRPYRVAREKIEHWIFDTPWPDKQSGYHSKRAGVWLKATFELMRDLREIYVQDGMDRYEKSGKKPGKDKIIKERVAQIENANKSVGQKAAETLASEIGASDV